jgi:hypothetical protein
MALRRRAGARQHGPRRARLEDPGPLPGPATPGAQLLRRPAHRGAQHGDAPSRAHAQLAGDEDKATTYYGLHTGIEIALGLRDPDAPLEIGVVGLGVGTIAAYGREGDHLRYFEIDPAVIRLTRDAGYFTFLARSKAKVDIIQGDGRISIARERAAGAPLFDYLIVDAYSSDAVPVHLLTREAIALYLDSIEPDGLLAIHTSSRYFDLTPTLSRLVHEAGAYDVQVANTQAPKHLTTASSWVFIAKSEDRVRAVARAAAKRARVRAVQMPMPPVRWPTPEMIASAPLWTDDYSNLFRVLK